jgi:hypothetical protein
MSSSRRAVPIIILLAFPAALAGWAVLRGQSGPEPAATLAEPVPPSLEPVAPWSNLSRHRPNPSCQSVIWTPPARSTVRMKYATARTVA